MGSTAGALALTDAFVGAFTEGGAAWAGTASIPATTRSDSRASARRDRIIFLILLRPRVAQARTPRAHLATSILVPQTSSCRPPASRRGDEETAARDARAEAPRPWQARLIGALSRANPSDMMAVPMSKSY